MSENEQMFYCLIAFILGWFLSRHMGNGFSVGANPFFRYKKEGEHCFSNDDCGPYLTCGEKMGEKGIVHDFGQMLLSKCRPE